MPRIKKTTKKKDGKFINIINIQTGRRSSGKKQVMAPTRNLTQVLQAQQQVQQQRLIQEQGRRLEDIGQSVRKLLNPPTPLVSTGIQTMKDLVSTGMQTYTPTIQTKPTQTFIPRMSFMTQTEPEKKPLKMSFERDYVPQATRSSEVQTEPMAPIPSMMTKIPTVKPLSLFTEQFDIPPVPKKERAIKDPVKLAQLRYDELFKSATESGQPPEFMAEIAKRKEEEIKNIKQMKKEQQAAAKAAKQAKTSTEVEKAASRKGKEKEVKELQKAISEVPDTSKVPLLEKERTDVEYMTEPSDVTTSEATLLTNINEIPSDVIQEPLSNIISLGSGSGLNPAVSLKGGIRDLSKWMRGPKILKSEK